MNYLSFIQVCLVVYMVRGDCSSGQNVIGSDSQADCNSGEEIANKLTFGNEIESHNFPSFGQGVEVTTPSIRNAQEVTSPASSILNKNKEGNEKPENDDRGLVLEDSSEKEKNVTQTVTHVTEFMEEFTRSTRPVSHTTTIETATWMYQGNRSSEESDESKITLIDYPFSVSVQRKGSHYASGALLDKWWIITSAGEFYNVRESLKLFRVRLGSVDCKSGGTIIPIKKIEIHPYYLPGKPNFDVALLRMAQFVDFSSFIRPIAISNIKGKVISAKFMTTYWPRILYKGTLLPRSATERIRYNSMRVSTQRLISGPKCSKTMQAFGEVLHESSLCLKPVITHHSVCMPDAGAPVIAEDGLWGITSGWISALCPNLAAPTIFTRLSSSSVRSWLDAQLLSSL